MLDRLSKNVRLLKMLFGMVLLLTLAILAGLIALGSVEEKSSYGLMPVLTALATLSGGFANWAFGQDKENDQKDKEQ